MSYRVRFDISEEQIADADAVEKFLEFCSTWIFPHGGRAGSYRFAPTGAPDVLRADLDFDTDRAAVRWLPDGTHVVELPETGPIVVLESSGYDVVTIPAELARVSVDTARRAVVEYVTTGRKPTGVTWVS